MEKISLQKTYAPHSTCFGCGPSHPQSLGIATYVEDTHCVADWTPAQCHEAFPGIVNGGVIGALFDCHSNWTAAWQLMQRNHLPHPPCTVTAKYAVRLLRPTPSLQPLHIVAQPIETLPDRVVVKARLTSQGRLCATCVGTFVAVQPGHPAYHRW